MRKDGTLLVLQTKEKKLLKIPINQMSGYIYAGEASREKPGRGGSRGGFYDAGSPTEERTEIRRPSDW